MLTNTGGIATIYRRQLYALNCKSSLPIVETI
jgi:hypothetical protein